MAKKKYNYDEPFDRIRDVSKEMKRDMVNLQARISELDDLVDKLGEKPENFMTESWSSLQKLEGVINRECIPLLITTRNFLEDFKVHNHTLFEELKKIERKL